MALLRKLSIKWKLSFALIATGLTLVSIYVLIAKRTFESDKISYVYDSQGARLESLKSELQSKLERSVLSARGVIVTFDPSLGKPTAVGEQLFNEEKSLLALELWNEEKAQTVFHLEKQNALLPPIDPSAKSDQPLGALALEPLDRGNYLITLRYAQGDQGIFRLRAVIDSTDLLPKASTTQSVALSQSHRILAVSDLRGIEKAVFEEIAKDPSEESERTHIYDHGKDRFLVSEAAVGVAGLRLFALTPENEALGALGTLFNRSLVFLFFSFFGLIAVSLLLARRLTLDLRILAQSAEEIGAGNFDATTPIESEDEMGILARAFAKMSQEIKRLLAETREKARMEEELKTASLVQERLMPRQSTTVLGELEVSGLVITSSECGGDWWYFFSRGDDLYVVIADATGHGTPAALITAAARSIFSRLEKEDISLVDMMLAWDFAVSSCSQHQVYMTGLLFRINFRTGQGAFVNAAHESPLALRANEDGTYSDEHLATDASRRIGDESETKFKETPFSLAPNEAVILYTDGLFSVVRDGRQLSERRFSRNLAGKAEFIRTAKDLTQATLDAFNKHRQDTPIPDDVSIVSIRREGPRRRAFLANDSGDVHVST